MSYTDHSSEHLQRFSSEAAGIALLATIAERYFSWNGRARSVTHFNDLTPSQAQQYKLRGERVRPDLLFDVGGYALAGEARGRKGRPPKTITRDQDRRLQAIFRWSQQLGSHPWCMSWASLSHVGTTVDLFFEAEDVKEIPEPEPPVAAEDRIPQLPSSPVSPDEPLWGVPFTQPVVRDRGRRFEGDVPSIPHQPPNIDVGLRRERAAAEISDTARRVQELLASSAQQLGREIGQVGHRRIFGEWEAVNQPGAEPLAVLVGLLDEPLPDADQEVEQVELQRPAGRPLQVDARGQLFVAVSRSGVIPEYAVVDEEFRATRPDLY